MPFLSYCRTVDGVLFLQPSLPSSVANQHNHRAYCLLKHTDSETLVSFSDRATGSFSSVIGHDEDELAVFN